MWGCVRMYKGYCMDKYGRYYSPVTLKEAKEIYDYCQLQKHFHYEIRIVEPTGDAIVVQVIEGMFVFPEEWKRYNTV